MYFITAVTVDELSQLLREGRLTLNNADFIHKDKSNLISNYMRQRLGSSGFCFGVIGRLTSSNVEFLSKFDTSLSAQKVILEFSIPASDALLLNQDAIDNTATAVEVGLPDADILSILDDALRSNDAEEDSSIVCVPYLCKTETKGVTSTYYSNLNIEGIQFIPLGGSDK